jgi:hypothetical protein
MAHQSTQTGLSKLKGLKSTNFSHTQINKGGVSLG